MKTQVQKLIDHLYNTGSITQREALMDYSIQSLTRRIVDIRNKGYNVKSEQRHHPVTGQRYVRYTLGSPARLFVR
jgi:hypothetical protein